MIIPAVQNPHWEACGLHERMLHRMQLAVARKAFDRRHLMAVGAKGRDKAAMHRRAIEPHGARAAVAGVAAFLDPEPSQVAKKGAQALAGPRLLRKRFAVDIDEVTHSRPKSSRRISSA
jgi:hypothetical protein